MPRTSPCATHQRAVAGTSGPVCGSAQEQRAAHSCCAKLWPHAQHSTGKGRGERGSEGTISGPDTAPWWNREPREPRRKYKNMQASRNRYAAMDQGRLGVLEKARITSLVRTDSNSSGIPGPSPTRESRTYLVTLPVTLHSHSPHE